MQNIRHRTRLREVQRDRERQSEKRKLVTKKERRRRRAVFPSWCKKCVPCMGWASSETASHLVPRASLSSPEIPNEIKPRQGSGAGVPLSLFLSLPGGLPQSATVQQTFKVPTLPSWGWVCMCVQTTC